MQFHFVTGGSVHCAGETSNHVLIFLILSLVLSVRSGTMSRLALTGTNSSVKFSSKNPVLTFNNHFIIFLFLYHFIIFIMFSDYELFTGVPSHLSRYICMYVCHCVSAGRHRLVSVLRGFLVLGVGHREEVLQLPLKGLECRSLHRVLKWDIEVSEVSAVSDVSAVSAVSEVTEVFEAIYWGPWSLLGLRGL